MLVGNWICRAAFSAKARLRSNFFFSLFGIVRGDHVFELLLDGRGRVREHLRLRIDRRHHQGNTGGNRFIFGKILEAVLLGDRLELGLVSGIGTVRKYGALHHLFHYRRHVLLSGDKSLDVLLCQLDLRYRDPRRCAGREASENDGHSRNGETKHLVHGGAPSRCASGTPSGCGSASPQEERISLSAALPLLRQVYSMGWPLTVLSRPQAPTICLCQTVATYRAGVRLSVTEISPSKSGDECGIHPT